MVALFPFEWHGVLVSKSRIGLICLAMVAIVLLLTAHSRRSFAGEPKELVFGMSAAFTGANGEMGIEFYRGVMAYLEHVNRQGGVNGYTLRILPTNDGYNPGPCFKNTVRFIQDDNVFALFSYLGTPTTTHILPLLNKFEQRDSYLLFPLTGAQPLRSPPYSQYVYNLRASYFEETAGLVDRLVELGRDRIAVFYQNDAYGRTGWDGVRRALRRHGKTIVSEAAYVRGATFEQDFTREVALLMNDAPDAIICIGTYASQGALIRDLRNDGYTLPVAGVSFADSDKMLELLFHEGTLKNRSYTENLIHTQVVPCYENTNLPSVRLYRSLMENYKGMPSVSEEGYTPRRFSYVSFEGFLNAMLLVEIIRRMDDAPSRDRIPEVIDSIRDFDLGIGTKVDFSNTNQGLHDIYFTTVRDNLFLPITDWRRWRK